MTRGFPRTCLLCANTEKTQINKGDSPLNVSYNHRCCSRFAEIYGHFIGPTIVRRARADL